MPGKSLLLDAEAEYNNRAAVPDHPVTMARWKADAASARKARPPVVLNYGPGARETVDLFEAGPDGPVALFIHGGYWQALDASWFSWVAPPLAPVVFVLVNGFLLGREYFQLVAMRRLGPEGARALARRHFWRLWLGGTLMAAPLTVPLLNLVIPILGVAVFTHQYHRLAPS